MVAVGDWVGYRVGALGIGLGMEVGHTLGVWVGFKVGTEIGKLFDGDGVGRTEGAVWV